MDEDKDEPGSASVFLMACNKSNKRARKTKAQNCVNKARHNSNKNNSSNNCCNYNNNNNNKQLVDAEE